MMAHLLSGMYGDNSRVRRNSDDTGGSFTVSRGAVNFEGTGGSFTVWLSRTHTDMV